MWDQRKRFSRSHGFKGYLRYPNLHYVSKFSSAKADTDTRTFGDLWYRIRARRSGSRSLSNGTHHYPSNNPFRSDPRDDNFISKCF